MQAFGVHKHPAVATDLAYTYCNVAANGSYELVRKDQNPYS